MLFEVTVQFPDSGFVLRGVAEENAKGTGHKDEGGMNPEKARDGHNCLEQIYPRRRPHGDPFEIVLSSNYSTDRGASFFIKTRYIIYIKEKGVSICCSYLQ